MGQIGGAYSNRTDPPALGRQISELARRQHGVISATQLRDLGADKYRVHRGVASGFLHPVYLGVYALGIPDISLRGRYMAAVLACAPAVLSHRAAAHLHGLRPNAGGHVEVTVPRRRDGRPGITVHRTRLVDPRDFTVEEGIRVTTVARTLLDLSAVVRQDELLRALDRAERLRIFDLTAVIDTLDRANGRRGARALRRAIATYKPSTQKSELERRFRDLLETGGGSPMPFFNALVDGERATHEVDAYWPEQRLAVQLDGFEFHRTRRDREHDADSDADLELAGIRVLRLTWDDVTVNGSRMLRRLRFAGGWTT